MFLYSIASFKWQQVVNSAAEFWTKQVKLFVYPPALPTDENPLYSTKIYCSYQTRYHFNLGLDYSENTD